MNTEARIRAAWAGKLLYVGTAALGAVLLPLLFAAEQGLGLWTLFKIRGPVAPPDEVVVIGIDEQTETALGGPITRAMHADLVQALAGAGAAVIVFDVFLHTESPDDDRLAAAIGAAGNVVLTARLERDTRRGLDLQVLRAPNPTLGPRAVGVGPWLVPAVFRVDWVFVHDDADRPTVPLLALQVFARDRPLGGDVARGLPPSKPGGKSRVGVRPRDDAYRANRLFVNYYGPPRTVQTLTYQDALTAAREGHELPVAGKAVFIGYSAQRQPGQEDDYPFVYSTAGFNLSGVELGATAFANLLHDQTVTLPPLPAREVLVVVWGLLMAASFVHLRLLMGIAAAVALGGAYLAAAVLAFGHFFLWLPIVTPVIQVLFAGAVAVRFKHLAERAKLGEGTSEEAALALIGRGEREKVDFRVILFADEQASKKRLRRALQELDVGQRRAMQRELAAARDTPIAAHGGHINHELADSMLATWVAPASSGPAGLAAQARAACRAALAIHSGVAAVAGRYPGFGPTLRIGLDWGEISSQLNPSPEIKDWKMDGAPIHAAERLESLNKIVGTSTLVSHAIAEHLDARELPLHELGTFVFCDDTGEIVVDPVRVYELLADRDSGAEQRDEAAKFRDALGALREGELQNALTAFERLSSDGRKHSGLAARYVAWCGDTLRESEPRWRGLVVVTFSDKGQYLDRFLR